MPSLAGVIEKQTAFGVGMGNSIGVVTKLSGRAARLQDDAVWILTPQVSD